MVAWQSCVMRSLVKTLRGRCWVPFLCPGAAALCVQAEGAGSWHSGCSGQAANGAALSPPLPTGPFPSTTCTTEARRASIRQSLLHRHHKRWEFKFQSFCSASIYNFWIIVNLLTCYCVYRSDGCRPITWAHDPSSSWGSSLRPSMRTPNHTAQPQSRSARVGPEGRLHPTVPQHKSSRERWTPARRTTEKSK